MFEENLSGVREIRFVAERPQFHPAQVFSGGILRRGLAVEAVILSGFGEDETVEIWEIIGPNKAFRNGATMTRMRPSEQELVNDTGRFIAKMPTGNAEDFEYVSVAYADWGLELKFSEARTPVGYPDDRYLRFF